MGTHKEKSVLLRVLVLCVSFFLLYNLIDLCSALTDGIKRKASYTKQIKLEQEKIAEYNLLLAEGNESKIIEKAARERLGFVYADEIVYIDVSGS